MNRIKITYFLLLAFLVSPLARAQFITVDQTLSPTQLVQDILINNPCANVSNVSVSTWSFTDGQSFGKFTAGTSTFPFADGVLLTTGRASSAAGPNTNILSEGPDNWLGDSDLEQALQIGPTSINATVLEFDFLPLADKISFDYIFSSEQYLSNPSQNQCGFTDGFVFLLKKANTTDAYTNLAVVPGTQTPVRVNTVRGPGTICPPANEQFFDAFNTSDHPTNYNGQTKILTAESTVEPGVLYHIKLVVADQGNRQYDSALFLGGGSFKIEKNLGDNRLNATNNPLCFQSTLQLDATEPGNNTYQWFKDGVLLLGETNPIFTVSEPGVYKVEINLSSSGCISTGEITIEYAAQLTPSPATLVQCDPDFNGITTFNLTKATPTILSTDASIQSVEFYTDEAATNQVDNATAFITSSTIVYAQVFNSSGCFEIVPITLSIANTSPNPPAPITFCDEDGTKDGIRQFNLATEVTPFVLEGLPDDLTLSYFANAQDATLGANALSNLFTNTTPNQQIIWAALTDGPDCFGIIPITLEVNFVEIPGFEDEERVVCEGLNAIKLEVPQGFVSYLWNDANQSNTNAIVVTTAGTYTVEVVATNGCTDTKTFIVTASGVATITDVLIEDFEGGDNTVTIVYEGAGVYEFSLDGETYQDNPVFINVRAGAYTVYVKDKNFCGRKTKEIFVLDYPKYFTPNGDGYNDVWKIEYLQLRNRFAKVHIFDRYGKLVFSGTGDNPGWDGAFNSQPLPASDYWFTVILENNRIIKGHFSLKR